MEHMLFRATNTVILNDEMKTAQQLIGNGWDSIGLGFHNDIQISCLQEVNEI